MYNGYNRFKYFLDQTNELLEKASQSKDPALWLLKSNARTPFFMLEALAKLYYATHKSKRFSKLKERFKAVEDGLGKIDHHNSLLVSLSKKKTIQAKYILSVKTELAQSIKNLNKLLIEENWIAGEKIRIVKIKKKLSKEKWLDAKQEAKVLTNFYLGSIKDIVDFIESTKYQFTDVELHIHELRRKLRWLSIYPHAMQGFIQLTAQSPKNTNNIPKKYLTKEIVNSPFNKIPPPGQNILHVKLNKDCFFVLSWMIAELGKIKDEGLEILGLAEVITHIDKCTNTQATEKSQKLLGFKNNKIDILLNQASSVTKEYVDLKLLERLITK